MSKLLDVNGTFGQEVDLNSYLPGFQYSSSWYTNTSIVYASDYFNKKLILIEETGSPEIKEKEGSYITAKNNRLEMKYQTDIPDTNAKDPYRIIELKIDSKLITFKTKGRIVGAVDNYLITLEIPPENTFQLIEPSEINNSQNSNEDFRKIMNKHISEVQETRLHIYSIQDASDTPKHTILLNKDGWYVIDVKIRPVNNTIVVLKHDRDLLEGKSKIVEIDPKNLENNKTLIDSEATLGAIIDLIYGYGGFSISEDGKWILGYGPNETNLNDETVGYSIKAWNLSNRKVLTLCQDSCNNIRLFNSNNILTY